MTAAAAQPWASEPPRFSDASPAQIRAALTPEDVADFDTQWREVMARATEDMDLAEVRSMLDSWRRTAATTSALGHAGYRRMLDSAAARLRTGERAPGSRDWDDIKVELGL